VHKKAEREQDTAEHPNITLSIYFVFEVAIDHLWRPIHHGGILFKFFHLLLQVSPIKVLRVEHAFAGGSEITKFETFIAQKDILNFDVPMLYTFLVHMLEALADVYGDVNYLGFR
jgi:hypothetical protein